MSVHLARVVQRAAHQRGGFHAVRQPRPVDHLRHLLEAGVEMTQRIRNGALEVDLAARHRACAELVLQPHDPVAVRACRRRAVAASRTAPSPRVPLRRAFGPREQRRHVPHRRSSRTTSRRESASPRRVRVAVLVRPPTSEPPDFSVMNCAPCQSCVMSWLNIRGRNRALIVSSPNSRIRCAAESVTLIGQPRPNSASLNNSVNACFATAGNGVGQPRIGRWLIAWMPNSP